MKIEKQCSKCSLVQPLNNFCRQISSADGLQRWCRNCRREYDRHWRRARLEVNRQYTRKYRKAHRKSMREYSRKNRENQRELRREYTRKYYKVHPERLRAATLVKKALRTGELTRLPCEQCGAPNAQAHHQDYSKPLDVVWLCPSCHQLRHYEIKADRTKNPGLSETSPLASLSPPH